MRRTVLLQQWGCIVLLLLALGLLVPANGLTTTNVADKGSIGGTTLLQHQHYQHTKRSGSSSSGYELKASEAAPPSDAGDDHEWDSQFDNTTATNVTAQLGTTAFLHCRVRHLGDRTVSWIRRKDFHILTVGLYTYSSDARFQMHHKEHTEDWTLQIKYTLKKDEGQYECQVSSDPPISLFVTLNVVVAKAEILGPADVYIKSGSTITLKCHISQSPEPPVYVFWYHNERMVNYDTARGGISVTTEKGDTSISTIAIRNAQRQDSGNYTCGPSNAEATSVHVHVLNGEMPAAMQHDGKASADRAAPNSPPTLVYLLLAVYFGLR